MLSQGQSDLGELEIRRYTGGAPRQGQVCMTSVAPEMACIWRRERALVCGIAMDFKRTWQVVDSEHIIGAGK